MSRTSTTAIALIATLGLLLPTAASAAPSDVTSGTRATSVKVTPSKPSVTRGKRAKLTVRVKGASGKIAVYRGKKKVKTLTLRNGKTVYRTPKKLKRGAHKFRFVHVRSGTNRNVKLLVRSKSKLTVTATPKSFYREDSPGRLNLKVVSDGKPAGGVFTVSEGSTTIAKAKAKAGKATVTLPTKLTKGKHTFTVTFDPKSKYVKAPTRKRVKVTVKSRAAFAGDGVFIVGVDVKPGLYVSRSNDYCYWARHSDFVGTIEANDSGDGDRYIRIKPTDKVIETSSCEDFEHAPNVKSPRTTIPGEGYYRIGYDLAPGLYRTDKPSERYCYWARLNDATGDSADRITNDGGYGVRLVQVAPSDVFLEVGDCGSWSKIG